MMADMMVIMLVIIMDVMMGILMVDMLIISTMYHDRHLRCGRGKKMHTFSTRNVPS